MNNSVPKKGDGMLRKTSYMLVLMALCGATQARGVDDPPFVAELPHGTVELVGVTEDYRPTAKSRWWGPDGSVRPIGSFRAVQHYHQPGLVADDKFRTLLVRIANLPADASKDPVGGVNVSTTPQGPLRSTPNWIAGEGDTVKNPTQRFTGSPLWSNGEHAPMWVATAVYCGLKAQETSTERSSDCSEVDTAICYPGQDAPPYFYRMFTTTFAGSSQTTDLRIGVSMGAWETVVTWSPNRAGKSTFWRDGRQWTVIFGKPTMIRKHGEGGPNSGTRIVVKPTLYTYGQWNRRLVAVTHDGSEHARMIPGGLDGNFGEVVFDELPLSFIKEIRLQVRPYCCVEFDNIAIQPGYETHVIVVSSDNSSNPKK